jgi:hypothetical protein
VNHDSVGNFGRTAACEIYYAEKCNYGEKISQFHFFAFAPFRLADIAKITADAAKTNTDTALKMSVFSPM